MATQFIIIFFLNSAKAHH